MMTLQDQLQAIKNKTAELVTPEVAAAMKQGFEELQKKGILENPLKVGDTAPAFSLANARGERIDPQKLLAKGPLVILFYRGKW